MLTEEVVMRAEANEEKHEDVVVLLIHKQDVVLHVAFAIVFEFARQLVILIFWF